MKKVVAFDIGGTSIRVALVSGGKISSFERIPTPRKKNLFLKEILRMIEERLDRDVKGIGIAFPGQVKDGRSLKAPNLPIGNFDLRRYLEKKFRKKVRIKNDAGCVALAESKLGVKKKNFIVLTLGTGIGGGMVVNGEEYSGRGLGAEFGHIFIRGKYLEELWQETRRQIKKKFKTTLMSDIVKLRVRDSKRVVDEVSDYMGEGIASLINALDPEVVILAGGVRECGFKLIGPIRKSVRRYLFLARSVPIFWTKLREPGVLGASLLV